MVTGERPKAKRYRYVCSCGAQSWLRNPNAAIAAAQRHADRYVSHATKNHGSAL